MHEFTRFFEAILAAAGWKVAIAVLVILVILAAAVRLAPQWLADRRERDRQEAEAKRRTIADAQARMDAKDALVEKIATNHIAHLEIQLEASREFYAVATERLSAISSDMKEARHKLESVGMEIAEVKLDTTVLRDRH